MKGGAIGNIQIGNIQMSMLSPSEYEKTRHEIRDTRDVKFEETTDDTQQTREEGDPTFKFDKEKFTSQMADIIGNIQPLSTQEPFDSNKYKTTGEITNGFDDVKFEETTDHTQQTREEGDPTFVFNEKIFTSQIDDIIGKITPLSTQEPFNSEKYKRIKTLVWNTISSQYSSEQERIVLYSVLRDVVLIRYLGYKKYVSICIGESKTGGFITDRNKEKFINHKTELAGVIHKIGLDLDQDTRAKDRYAKMKVNIEGCYKSVIIMKEIEKSMETIEKDHIYYFTIRRDYMGENVFRENIEENIVKEQVKKDHLYVIKCYLDMFDTLFKYLKFEGIFNTQKLKQHGGNTMTIRKSETDTPKLKKITKYIGMIILMIYFSGVLIESYRLICFQIERIHRARATYLGIYGYDERAEDEDFISYIMTFFKVMYEVAHGSIIEMIDSFKSTETSNTILNLLQVSSSEATRNVFESCSDNYFGCINGFFTGVTSQHLLDSTRQNLEFEIQTAFHNVMNDIRKETNDILFQYNSSVTNFVTAISGLEFVCVLGLNIIFPEIYTSKVVFSSFTLLQTSYSTQNMFWRIGVISSQLIFTFAPGTIHILNEIINKPRYAITREDQFMIDEHQNEPQSAQRERHSIDLLTDEEPAAEPAAEEEEEVEAAEEVTAAEAAEEVTAAEAAEEVTAAEAAAAEAAAEAAVEAAKAMLDLRILRISKKSGGNNKYRKKIQNNTKRKKTKRNKTKRKNTKRKNTKRKNTKRKKTNKLHK